MKKWLKKLESLENHEPAKCKTLPTVAEAPIFPDQKETIYPAHAPKANCMSCECDFCCMPVIDGEPFLYCNQIGYGVYDLWNNYGACPLGYWAKSQKHYNNLISEMGNDRLAEKRYAAVACFKET